MTQISHIWGGITDLTKQYKVSRTFIYDLLSTFKNSMGNLFFPQEKTDAISREEVETNILTYRFEGKCSIEAISTLMKRTDTPCSSVGFISQFLSQTGNRLPNTLEIGCEKEHVIVFADDEIFSKNTPILITVDPVSSAIIRIEQVEQRTADKWVDHYHAIVNNGLTPRLSTSDAGAAMMAAREEEFPNIQWQSDTFHGIAHRLGDWNRQLEKTAYAAIQNTDNREEKLESAKSDRVIKKRFEQWFNASENADQSVDLYDNFNYLYKELIHQLNSFDANGNLRPRDQAEETLRVALELIESLGHKAINKAVAGIKKALPDLLVYFDDAKQAVNNCKKLTDNKDVLSSLYLAWQWDKAVIKSKQNTRKHKAVEQRQFYLEMAALFLDDHEKFSQLKKHVYAELDQIIQASSMVECINSILRPYLNNSKNLVTQEFLNTFMFYHNHRRYLAGKRKGQTPMEILTGKPQKKDWIELLQEEVKKRKNILTA